MDDLFSLQELTESSSIVLARARAGHTVRLYDPEGYDFSLCSTRQLEELRQLAESRGHFAAFVANSRPSARRSYSSC